MSLLELWRAVFWKPRMACLARAYRLLPPLLPKVGLGVRFSFRFSDSDPQT